MFLDPIARLRRAGLDETHNERYAVVIKRSQPPETERRRRLGAHTGHPATTCAARATSTVWESRLAFKRDGNTVTITTEHREAEPGDPIAFDLAGTTRPAPCGSALAVSRPRTLPRPPRRHAARDHQKPRSPPESTSDAPTSNAPWTACRHAGRHVDSPSDAPTRPTRRIRQCLEFSITMLHRPP